MLISVCNYDDPCPSHAAISSKRNAYVKHSNCGFMCCNQKCKDDKLCTAIGVVDDVTDAAQEPKCTVHHSKITTVRSQPGRNRLAYRCYLVESGMCKKQRLSLS